MADYLEDVQAYLGWLKEVYGDHVMLDGAITVAEPPPTTAKALQKAKPAGALKSVRKRKSNGPKEDLIHQGDIKLKTFYEEIRECQKCPLGKTRRHFVFGMGNPAASIMFVGEAPGAEEDAQGLPFVGRAGKLLDKMLFAMQLNREDVYIANILKCRPPNNRDPQEAEVEQCEPYLKKQIEMIKPSVLIALGRISAQVLLKTNAPLSRLRNHEHSYAGIPFIVTYHPAALLRNPHFKSDVWNDLKKIGNYL